MIRMPDADSEAKYRALVDHSLTGIIIVTRTEIRFANRTFEEIFGYTQDDIRTMAPWDMVHPSERDIIRQMGMGRLRNQPVREIYETRWVRRDGRPVWVEVRAVTIEDRGDPAILVNVVDISERKKAEKALRISEEKYRMVVENASEAIAVSQDDHFIFVNPKAIELIGYPREELLSRPFIEFVHPEDRNILLLNYRRRLMGQTAPGIYPVRIVDKDGSIRWLEINVVSINWQDRPATLDFLNDITARKTAETKLHHRLQMEALISSISTHFLDLKGSEIGDGTARALQRIGEFSGVSRSYIVKFSRENNSMTITYEWAADNCPRAEKSFDHVPLSNLSWLLDRLEIDRTIDLSRLSDLPPEGAAVRDFFEAEGIKSMLLLAMSHAGASGFLAFDSLGQERVWTAEDMALLRMVGQVFVSALERKRFEEALQKREEELAFQAKNLEEANAALSVLLKRREEDQRELEEKVLANIEELVVPFVNQVRIGRLDPRQIAYIDMIESNLRQITSPFSRSLSSRFSCLTPKEIQIANLIKEGMTTKEIAEILQVTMAAVHFHRYNIRKKMGLNNAKTNLRSFLLSV